MPGQLIDILAEAATDYAAETGIAVSIESNVAPEITLYDAAATGPSVLDLLGIQTQVIARDGSGRVLATYGEPVNPNPVLAAIYGTTLVLGFLGVTALAAKFLRK